MHLYRIHGRRYSPLDGWGAAIYGGRWNPPGIQLIYTAVAYEGALLEQLVLHGPGEAPTQRIASRIALPERCEIRVIEEADHPDWRNGITSRRIGRNWVASGESVAMQVPSYVAQPWGRNVILNPLHPDFGRVRVVDTVRVAWDGRLF